MGSQSKQNERKIYISKFSITRRTHCMLFKVCMEKSHFSLETRLFWKSGKERKSNSPSIYLTFTETYTILQVYNLMKSRYLLWCYIWACGERVYILSRHVEFVPRTKQWLMINILILRCMPHHKNNFVWRCLSSLFIISNRT